jgi:chemotaxis protein MotA
VDFATLLGLFGAFTVIGLAMFLGGSPDSFIDLPAILIVGVGSFLVTAISFTWHEMSTAQQIILRAIVYHTEEPGEAAREVLKLAKIARRDGVLSLQKTLSPHRDNPFLHRAVTHVVDGASPTEVEGIMEGELLAMSQRHNRSAGILRRAGEVAPAMGLIGTLVGLVQMLGNLEEPSTIGPAMALALLTTFYGAVLANMVLLPLAKKLERNSEAESQVNRIYAAGAASICREENPRRLETLLNTILPPGRRMNLFD